MDSPSIRADRPSEAKRIVVTGASAGIGERASRELAAQGHTVVLVGRSRDRLEAARTRILQHVPAADLLIECADLALMTEVRALAARLAAQPPPDVVISNAAVIAPVDDMTEEGLPRTVAVNHLAPYALLQRLVPVIGDRPARFVVLSGEPRSLARVRLDLDDLASTRRLGPVPSFRPFVLYARTKLMNAMFSHGLARRLADSRITVNAVHPGIVPDTSLARHDRGALKVLGRALGRFSAGDRTGAETAVWLAASAEPEGVTGQFWVDRERVTTAAHMTDTGRCDRLWEQSARLVEQAAAPARRG